jgi:hypothetical protein
MLSNRTLNKLCPTVLNTPHLLKFNLSLRDGNESAVTITSILLSKSCMFTSVTNLCSWHTVIVSLFIIGFHFFKIRGICFQEWCLKSSTCSILHCMFSAMSKSIWLFNIIFFQCETSSFRLSCIEYWELYIILVNIAVAILRITETTPNIQCGST